MGLRVTGGTLLGQQIRSPKGSAVRPTSSRVRESLFSILGQGLHGMTVLDLFAGAGTLGIEAASRGAQHVVFVEQDRAHARCVETNARLLEGLASHRVLRMDAVKSVGRLASEGDRFDLVFCDPPYDQGLAGEVLKTLGDAGPSLLQDDARVVFETSPTEDLSEAAGTLARQGAVRRYGSTCLSVYCTAGGSQ